MRRELSKLDRLVQDWFCDLFTYREEKRSTKQLRKAICDEIERLEADPDDPSFQWSMKRYRGDLKNMNRAALIAVLNASTHPEYKLAEQISSRFLDDRGPVALFFHTLQASELSDFSYGGAVYNLSYISPKKNVYLLHRKSPEGANALLRLVIHFMIHGTGVGLMAPEVKSNVLANPRLADELIEFSAQRKYTCLNNLDYDQFKEALNSPSQALRDGLL